MKAYIELRRLWRNLSFYVFMQEWANASHTSDKIEEYKTSHPIAYYIAKFFH